MTVETTGHKTERSDKRTSRWAIGALITGGVIGGALGFAGGAHMCDKPAESVTHDSAPCNPGSVNDIGVPGVVQPDSPCIPGNPGTPYP